MAIYHLSAKTGSRKGGQSARAKSDYIRREGAYQRDAAELVHTCSANMPAWSADDPSIYWRAADEHERANGRLFKELDFALPRELDRSAQVDLAERFADHLAGDESLPYTLAIHRGRGSNPHVHLMISERINDGVDRTPETWFKRWNGPAGGGGARKSSALKPKEWLEETRAAWSEYANAALDEVGSRERIDHRSLFDQGEAELEPQIHLGPKAAHALREGVDTKRVARWESIADSNARIVFERAQEAERRVIAPKIRAEAARDADALAARQAREVEWRERERHDAEAAKQAIDAAVRAEAARDADALAARQAREAAWREEERQVAEAETADQVRRDAEVREQRARREPQEALIQPVTAPEPVEDNTAALWASEAEIITRYRVQMQVAETIARVPPQDGVTDRQIAAALYRTGRDLGWERQWFHVPDAVADEIIAMAIEDGRLWDISFKTDSAAELLDQARTEHPEMIPEFEDPLGEPPHRPPKGPSFGL